MKVLYYDRRLNEKDVEEINKIESALIDIETTLNQDSDIISKINPKCLIKVFPKSFSNHNGIMKKAYMTYTPENFSEILRFFEKIEEKISYKWSDLEKAVYIYTEIQKLPKSTQEKFVGVYDLSPIITKNANSQSLATIYCEALSRQNIPCRYMFNDEYEAWNEIKIGDKYYPVDLKKDVDKYIELNSIEHKRNEEYKPVEPALDNFASNKEFYEEKSHVPCKQAELLSREDMKSVRALEKDEIITALNKARANVERKDKDFIPKEIERKDIKLKSKELSSIFENNEITKEKYNGQSSISIEITDNNHSDLISDLDNIGKYYPEILNHVELKNNTKNHISFQKIIDKIYDVKTDNEFIGNNDSNIKIATTNPEDFDLDFSKAPKIIENQKMQGDGKARYQGIEFVNLDSSKPMKLPNFSHDFSENISRITFENISFDGVTVNRIVNRDGLKRIDINGTGTQNINAITGVVKAHQIGINKISDREFNEFISNVYKNCAVLDTIEIENQKLQNRPIFKSLAKNPNVSFVSVKNSKVNNLDGLEDFNGRIAQCYLSGNDLQINDLERMYNFKRINPYLQFELLNNTGIMKEISNMPQISTDSQKILADYYSKSGEIPMYLNKKNCMNSFSAGIFENVPYYAKDAEIVRSRLKAKSNPMMVKDNSEIDSLNFNSIHMENGTMLFTISQIEHLLNSGKIIPQNVRVKIDNASQLDNTKLEDLQNRMNSKGMNITGVQIIDKDSNNNRNQIAPYTVDEYKYVRKMLEKITEGINNSEPDIDKFTTIYMRVAESIPYDYKAIIQPDMKVAGGIYWAKHVNSSRNMYAGLKEGTCVCSGYADILKNALSLVGIESRNNTGLCRKGNPSTGHAWNQVKINGKWYYTDLTWDEKKSTLNPKDRDYKYMLLGKDKFINHGHEETNTKIIENVEKDEFSRRELKAAIKRNEFRSFDITIPDIVIEKDPSFKLEMDDAKIKNEYKRRKDDMLAKYYGNKDYQNEYELRSSRFKSREKNVTVGGITYTTVEDYPERKEDEEFLLLDGYKDSIERVTRYESGDRSIYASSSNPTLEYAKDKEYVETRNNTFNQHESTSKDLATLGKYGEHVPYIPKQDGIMRNVGRGILNTGIFIRNLAAPVYRACGKYIGQPIHRFITRNSDASPYRNNIYHRMVARRDYFQANANQRDEQETANLKALASDPSTIKPVSHPIRNALESRFKALFNVQEGNKAVLSAGLADIKANIMEQEGQRAMISSYNKYINDLNAQISNLQNAINSNPRARNISSAKSELNRKTKLLKSAIDSLNIAKKQDKIISKQTDAIDAKQHSIASKEVNTMRVTAIKGIAKGAAIKFFGPKIKDFILEHTKIKQSVEVNGTDIQPSKKWVDTTYKTEVQDVYDDVVNKSKSIKDLMSSNKGNNVTGFYSVYGGEKGASLYELTGDEKITGIFQSMGKGGKGLSDTVGLQAPTLTDGTFAKELLNQSGLLNQDISIDKLLSTLSSNKVDLSAMKDLYVSVDDRCWVKLSDLLPGITEKVKVDEIVNTVVDKAGHYETIQNVVNTTNTVSKVVNNSAVEKGVNMTKDVLKGLIGVDSIIDLGENLRNTKSKVKGKKNKDYNFSDEETQDLPTSKRDYDNER